LAFSVKTPPPDLVTAVSSASLSDAMATRYQHRWHVLDLICPRPGAVLHGWAATVRFMPRRADLRDPDRHDFAPAVLACAGDDAAGSVLVIACGSYRDVAVAGGKKLTLVDALGFNGLLTDGRMRDFDEAGDLRAVAYCSGETVLADTRDLMAFDHGLPVELAGVIVSPGDWVYADAAGAVVVPGDAVEEILEVAVERERADAAESRRIRAEHARPT
jgi:4-hydroxy-4-methyl-2-oxoglutarate aldolase